MLDKAEIKNLHDAEFIAQAREGWPAALDEIERLKRLLYDEQARHEITKCNLAFAEADISRLRIALHDAISRPKGVVPDSAAEFYDQNKGER